MKKYRVYIFVILIIANINVINAEYTETSGGNNTYPGCFWIKTSNDGYVYGPSYAYYNGKKIGNQVQLIGKITGTPHGNSAFDAFHQNWVYETFLYFKWNYNDIRTIQSYEFYYKAYTSAISFGGDCVYGLFLFCPVGQNYTISGTANCLNYVELYSEGTLLDTDDLSDNYYQFDILNNITYNMYFNNGHWYNFTCNGSGIEYNYSACIYIYGYTCNINWVKLWRNDAGSWTYVDMESQPNHGLNTYVLQIDSGYDYKVNFSDGHEHEFTCNGSDIRYDWDRCVWAYPPSPWQPPETIPWYLGYDNNIVFMRDSHGNFIENAQIAVYNKNTGNYTQKWTNTPDPYILLAANNDSNDDVIVMCRTFDGVFTLETVDPAFGTDENVTWTNWTIPIMYNLEIHPIDQSNMPLHHVFVSMYEYTPFDPLAFFGYDIYWGCIPVTNCSGFSRCDIVAEKEGYRDYNVTGLNWTTKSALIKDYKQDIVLARES